MQLCRIIYYSLVFIAALHVSSDIFAHHQEHLNCITASGITHVCRCQLATRWNSFTSLLLDVCVWLNMFRALPRLSSGAFNFISSLWFYRWSVAVAALLVVVWPDHDQQRCYQHAPTVKPEAANAVLSSWWWARKCPKHVEPHINVK
jgi:hypothetical protein